jgi:hypothetical protein
VTSLSPDARAGAPGAALGDNSALLSLQLLRGEEAGEEEVRLLCTSADARLMVVRPGPLRVAKQLIGTR